MSADELSDPTSPNDDNPLPAVCVHTDIFCNTQNQYIFGRVVPAQ